MGLRSRAFKGHDREPSRAGRDLRAEIAPNEVKT
jgi:hypothetical protein